MLMSWPVPAPISHCCCSAASAPSRMPQAQNWPSAGTKRSVRSTTSRSAQSTPARTPPQSSAANSASQNRRQPRRSPFSRSEATSPARSIRGTAAAAASRSLTRVTPCFAPVNRSSTSSAHNGPNASAPQSSNVSKKPSPTSGSGFPPTSTCRAISPTHQQTERATQKSNLQWAAPKRADQLLSRAGPSSSATPSCSCSPTSISISGQEALPCCGCGTQRGKRRASEFVFRSSRCQVFGGRRGLSEGNRTGRRYSQDDAFDGEVGESLVVVLDDLVPTQQPIFGSGVAVRDEVDVVAEGHSSTRGRVHAIFSLRADQHDTCHRRFSQHRIEIRIAERIGPSLLDAKVSRLQVDRRMQRPAGLGSVQGMGLRRSAMLDQHDGHSIVAGAGNQTVDHVEHVAPVLLKSVDETLLNVDHDQSRRVQPDWRLLSIRARPDRQVCRACAQTEHRAGESPGTPLCKRDEYPMPSATALPCAESGGASVACAFIPPRPPGSLSQPPCLDRVRPGVAQLRTEGIRRGCHG